LGPEKSVNFPSISVIVPSFGREDALLQNLNDLVNQTHKADEIIVVLQKPNLQSASLPLIRDLASKHRILLNEVEFAHAQKARNLAFRLSKGEIVLLLDDDIRCQPDLVEMHLRNYVEDSSLDGVAGQILEEKQEPTKELPKRYYWPFVGWQHLPLNYAIRTETKNWPSTNSSIRRKFAVMIGGFDEQFDRTWFDDSDFSYRLVKAGAKLIYDPRAKIIHLKVPLGGKRPASTPMMILDRNGWAIYFYFWRKDFGMWKARLPALLTLRLYIFRKKLLMSPIWFIRNWLAIIQGWNMASAKLKEGPLYCKFN
jgi:GT2 family glycosyltransferase